MNPLLISIVGQLAGDYRTQCWAVRKSLDRILSTKRGSNNVRAGGSRDLASVMGLPERAGFIAASGTQAHGYNMSDAV